MPPLSTVLGNSSYSILNMSNQSWQVSMETIVIWLLGTCVTFTKPRNELLKCITERVWHGNALVTSSVKSLAVGMTHKSSSDCYAAKHSLFISAFSEMQDVLFLAECILLGIKPGSELVTNLGVMV